MRNAAFPYQYGIQPYYVKYKDGEESMLMSWKEAKDYAEIFGGIVLKAEPVYERYFFGLLKRVSHYI